MVTVSVDLSDRYGTGRSRQRVVVVSIAVAVSVVFLGWLAWATWSHSTPDVSSQLGNYKVIDVHTVKVSADIHLEDDVEANCLVRALAADHAVVGELNFRPDDGHNEVTVRTEREATSVDLVGCTTKDQNRPR